MVRHTDTVTFNGATGDNEKPIRTQPLRRISVDFSKYVCT